MPRTVTRVPVGLRPVACDRVIRGVPATTLAVVVTATVVVGLNVVDGSAIVVVTAMFGGSTVVDAAVVVSVAGATVVVATSVVAGVAVVAGSLIDVALVSLVTGPLHEANTSIAVVAGNQRLSRAPERP